MSRVVLALVIALVAAGPARITREGRVSIISGYRGRLAVSKARGSGSDRLELARLNRRRVLPGRLVHEAS